MPILKYTTKIDPDKTAGEIAKLLSMAGAKAVLTEYNDEDNYVSALSFKLVVNGQELGIKLPCDWKPVLNILEEDRKVPRSFVNREQAVRVAWRIVLAWVEAQLAIIQTKMVKTEEVFMPYIITKSGKTLFEQVAGNNFLLDKPKN
jgi:hypothetical protein